MIVTITDIDRQRLRELADALTPSMQHHPTLGDIAGALLIAQRADFAAGSNTLALDPFATTADTLAQVLRPNPELTARMSLNDDRKSEDPPMSEERRAELLGMSSLGRAVAAADLTMTPERRKELLDKYAPLPAF